ncbi:MAG: AbrB/MazE/SpoVT family DNA-binding domain-containing protein, partial [Metallosphaera sp.]
MEKYRVRVGKKGELYLPKALRQKTRIKVNSEVEVRIERDRIIIDVIPSLEDLLSKRKTVKLTPEEFEEISEEVQR